MEECPSIRGCPFFNDKLADRPATANMLKRAYCQSDYLRCARLMVSKALGSAAVPADLFPNMADRAHNILHAH
jgi:hypothetical protein